MQHRVFVRCTDASCVCEGRILKEHDQALDIVAQRTGGYSHWGRVRRGVLFSIGSGCFILGMVLIATLVRPDTLQKLGTLELAVIVGFITLPALTLVSIRNDRKTVRSFTSSSYPEVVCVESVAPDQITRVAHVAHDRGSRATLHVRPSESVTQDMGQTDLVEQV